MSEPGPETAPRMFAALWRLLGRRERREFVWLLVLSVLMALATLGGVASIVPFFALLGDPQFLAHDALLSRLFAALGFRSADAFVVFLGCGFVAIVIAASAINLLGTLALQRFALRVGRNFYVDLFAEYLRRDYLFHARNGVIVLFNNITYEAARVVAGIVQGGLTLIASLCVCAILLASIVVLSPAAALLAVAVFGGTYAAIYLLARRRLLRNGRVEGELWDSRARTLTESFGAIREILLRGNQRFFRDAFARDCDELARVGASTFAIAQSPRYALECVMAFALVAFALWTSRDAGATPWLARLGFVAFAAYRILPSMQQAFAALARVRADRAAFARIVDDLRNARAGSPAGTPDGPPAAAAVDALRPRREIRARGVSFRYAPDAAPAVRDVSLVVPAGAAVGFVGANGSGKSTMADLLLGLLTPQSGTIEVDGVPLDADTLPAWRANLACVPQAIYLLDASLAENVAFGVPRAQIDPARLEEALAAAGLDALAAALPGGAWAGLGERGVRLSGGQRQRIGIARALYRRSAVLVLDEATASLDGLVEREFTATLAALRGRVTVIAIAHRLSSLRGCDVIYEFADAAISDSGRFEDLTRRSARFRELAGVGS